jgi:hypothetical protein
MPCYLFTWHAYGSWLPDHPQGYVHWKRGYEASNLALALRYQQKQQQSSALLLESAQRKLIDEILVTAEAAHFLPHCVATVITHIHALVSWDDQRSSEQLRRSIRRSLTQRLNSVARRKWFSRGGHAKQVRGREHFDYLTTVYLPSHSGWKWCKTRGIYK